MRIFKMLAAKGLLFPVPKSVLRLYVSVKGLMQGATIGVRAVILDDQDRVFLVRHSYVNGWFLPGGGVDKGEAPLDAIYREVAEETGLEISSPPSLLGFYLNDRQSQRDHVALYLVRDWADPNDRLTGGGASADGEIAESGFFALDALPSDTSSATRARLAELGEAGQRVSHW